ncbi:hypothetical protein BDK51DRAFT_43937 [Blyttiomyces helicus]|uniref:Uncharacterized protein n=1 Tax=Blyttiomyces helicus TaxID=388810 RepID=A0A4P9WIR6_9FUNG|nr:hypothetical protein BDK51DRAFT_43937 [Blyttiomyces helicus]|eukprot:RKO91915.1 hypothetical protein BDK51DRAFT_43937 [Blyttiomyces helicus]
MAYKFRKHYQDANPSKAPRRSASFGGKHRRLGYGDLSNKTDINSILVCGEAKCNNSPQNIWQIVAYCGIVHKARLTQKKQNSTVYGFVTDAKVCEFVRIDNESKFGTSAKASTLRKTMTWLRYCAQKSIPSSTPATSKSDLPNNQLKNFKLVVERFRTTDGVAENEVEYTGSVFPPASSKLAASTIVPCSDKVPDAPASQGVMLS